MELLIVIGLPLLLAAFVFAFFWRDRQYFQQKGQQEVGELEALMRRHRIGLILHLVAFLMLLPLMIFVMNNYALLGAILLAVVFLGHISTLNRLSRPLIAALHFRNEYRARLESVDELENERKKNSS